MQNPIDMTWDENSEWTKEHIIQALANLGQRVGIKGDSIAYKSFTFNDILNEVYPSDKYIGFIEYFKDDELNTYKAKFGVTDKFNLYNSNKETVIDINTSINNALVFPSDLSFTVPINNIEKYSKNSICINEDNELTFMLAGKVIGSTDTDLNNTNLYYYKFDILSNKLKIGYKLFSFNNLNGDDKNYYCLIQVKNNDNNGQLSNTYTLSIKVFNIDELLENNTYLINNFKQLFNYTSYNISSNIPFSIISEQYKDINALLSYNSDYELHYDSNSAISVILNNVNSSKYLSKEIQLDFDTYKNELLSVNEELLDQSLRYFIEEYGVNLYEELYMINEDINKTYINIFKYYNEKFYLEYKSTFIKRILYKIYERSTEFNHNSDYRLYIPLDYKFHYICNSNNDLNIYYSNNIYVTYTSLKGVELESFWKLNSNLIYDYNGIDKVKVYNFEVTYNKLVSDLINTIDIKDIYTMPYINADNNWSVNDIDTKIRAIGKDAGNPNIIIIFNKNHNDYEVLNTISNKNILESVDYTKEWFKINPALFENVNDTNIRCCAFIPKIDNSLYNYFKDSLILSVSTLDCFEYDLYKPNYKGSYVYTFWHIVETDGNIKFELINDTDTSYALSIGSTVNLLNAYNDTSVSNLNDQDVLLLKAIISDVAQETLSISSNNWIVMKNKQSEEYTNEYKLSTSDYNNDLNISLEYNDSVNLISNYAITKHNTKYISSLDNLSITNSLYPKYIITNTSEIISSKQQVNSIINRENDGSLLTSLVNQRNSRIFIDSHEIVDSEELIEYLKPTIQETSAFKNIEIVVENKEVSNSNYNEYVFNSNIPSIDFKELFIRNISALNRLNIISLDSNGKIFNAYIGTSFDESNKNTLHLGSTNTNINIGSNTLINESDRTKFNTHDTLSIDFDNIKLNSSKKITSKLPVITTTEYNGVTYNCCTIDLIGRYNKYSIDNDIVNNSLFLTEDGHTDKVKAISIVNALSKIGINLLEYNDYVIKTNSYFHVVDLLLFNDDEYYFEDLCEIDASNSLAYSFDKLEIMYYLSSSTNSNNTLNIFVSLKR